MAYFSPFPVKLDLESLIGQDVYPSACASLELLCSNSCRCFVSQPGGISTHAKLITHLLAEKAKQYSCFKVGKIDGGVVELRYDFKDEQLSKE